MNTSSYLKVTINPLYPPKVFGLHNSDLEQVVDGFKSQSAMHGEKEAGIS